MYNLGTTQGNLSDEFLEITIQKKSNLCASFHFDYYQQEG
jgi:hypothetical protein